MLNLRLKGDKNKEPVNSEMIIVFIMNSNQKMSQ